jgi:acyl dehydratase
MTTTHELTESPRLRSLYPRALAGAGRAALGRLPGLGREDGSLPDVSLALRGVEVDRAHLTEYCRVCGFRLRDELPPTYPHVLAFPLSMQLMTGGDFPFPVMGLVHVANRIAVRRALRAGEPLDLRVWAEGPEPHERGTRFHVIAEGAVDGEAVWRGASTYLHKEGGSGGSGGSRGGVSGAERNGGEPRPGAVWELPGDLGRRYAAVSGDRNPIHLHPLSSRLFGMSRPIAHGMWLKARCLAALEGHLPGAYAVDVRFKLPLPLPSRVIFSSRAEKGERVFEVRDPEGKPHLVGRVEPH